MCVIQKNMNAVFLGLLFCLWSGGALAAGPQVLAYADFEDAAHPLSAQPQAVREVTSSFNTACPGALGKGIVLDDGTFEMDLPSEAFRQGGTVSFSYRMLEKCNGPLLELVDAQGQILSAVNCAGAAYAKAEGAELTRVGGTVPQLIPNDKLSYQWRTMALTWAYDASTRPGAPDVVRLWTDFGISGSLSFTYSRTQPVKLRIRSTQGLFEFDELFVVDTALTAPALFVLDSFRGGPLKELDAELSKATLFAGQAESSRRNAALCQAAREPIVAVEAESLVSGGKTEQAESITAIVVEDGLSLPITVPEEGSYVVLLNYRHSRWFAQHRDVDTKLSDGWENNAARLITSIGDYSSEEAYYPTGEFWNWSCDTEVYKWHALNKGQPIHLPAGTSMLDLQGGGISLDMVMLVPEPVPGFTQPRYIDDYQIPPAMTVLDILTETNETDRIQTMTLSFRPRLTEPMDYRITLDTRLLGEHRAELSTNRLHIANGEAATMTVRLYQPLAACPSSARARLHMWNEQTLSWMPYDVWSVLPEEPLTDEVFCEQPVSPELRALVLKWVAETNFTARQQMAYQMAQMGQGRLGDCWRELKYFMSLTPEQLDDALPDGIVQPDFGPFLKALGKNQADCYNAAYMVPEELPITSPTGWIVWHEPAGDIDAAETIHGENWNKTDYVGTVFPELTRRTCTFQKGDPDWNRILETYRLQVWVRFIGNFQFRTMQQGGLPLLSRMYTLTGDPAYAQQAYRIIEGYVNKCVYYPKTHGSIRRDDRDIWGTYTGMKWATHGGYGYFTEVLNAYDRCRSALTLEQRQFWEYNGLRATFWDLGHMGRHIDPMYSHAVNMERLPPAGVLGAVFGDQFFVESAQRNVGLYLESLLEDGMHVCNLSTYGHSMMVTPAMIDVLDQGYPLWNNPDQVKKLFNAVETACQFFMMNGQIPNFGHGAGNSWNDGVNFSPEKPVQLLDALAKCYHNNKEQFAANGVEQVDFGSGISLPIEEAFLYLRRLTDIPQQLRPANGDERKLDVLYSTWTPDPELQPSRLAPVKGMALLRNREADSWKDWIEVYFDYGIPNKRAHDDNAKLHVVLGANGQIEATDYGYHNYFNSPTFGHLWQGWSASTISHCTVMVDGKNQAQAPGVNTLFTNFGPVQAVSSYSDQLYPGVRLERTLVVAEGYVLDLFSGESSTEHQYDWMWHNYGSLEDGLPFVAAPDLAQQKGSEGLQYAKNMAVCKPAVPFEVVWKNPGLATRNTSQVGFVHSVLSEPHQVRLWGLTPDPDAVIRFEGPEFYSVEKKLDYLWTRKTGRNVMFTHILEPRRDSSPDKILNVRLVPVTNAMGSVLADTEAVAVVIECRDGQSDLVIWNRTGADVQAEGTVCNQALLVRRSNADGERVWMAPSSIR